MMKSLINQRLNLAAITTLLKYTLFGFITAELFCFTFTITKYIHNNLQDTIEYRWPIYAISLALVAAASLHIYVRDGHEFALRVIRSYRFDVCIAFLFGAYISTTFLGLGSGYYLKLEKNLSHEQLIALFSLPLLIGILLIARAILSGLLRKKGKFAPFFLSDLEKTSPKADLLGLSSDVERFAERVINGKAPDSIVFAIDAPWGIGKSSFINFCSQYWRDKHGNTVIVYKFNLLRFVDRSNILEKFVDGLIRTIQKNIFIPDVEPLFSTYSRFLKGKGKFSILAT